MLRRGYIRTKDAALLCAVLLFFMAFCLPFSSYAADAAEIKEVRFWKSPDYIRFVFDLSKPVEFTSGKLSNPERLFFDLKNARLSKKIKKTIEVNNEFVKSVRFGQFSSDTARIVFDITAQSYSFKILNLEDPSRLVVDIFGVPKKEQGKTDIKAEAKPKDRKPEPRQAENLIRRTVVIDAGHGGHDSGAIGPTGLYEKNVVLDIAIRIRQTMKKSYPAYKVILTRESDVFIPLKDRPRVAEKNNADLFLSVHANASTNRRAGGIETYLLTAANSEAALKTAARENGVSLAKMKQTQNEMDVILASLASQNKREESIKLAGNIQTSLTGKVGRKYPQIGKHGSNGVKGAPFYVLYGAEMPSALVEVSFISNPTEEKLLKTEAYRQMLAQSIVDGIHKYFISHPAQHIVSDDRKTDNSPKVERISYIRSRNAK